MAKKGEHLSESTKQKLRTAALRQFKNGVPLSTIKKLKKARVGRKPMLGKKHSKATIARFKVVRKLWWNDPVFREKSLSRRRKLFGAANPMWKGGVTPIIRLIRNSKKYHEWRMAVYKKDKFTCQECEYTHVAGKRRRILDADHVIPFAFLIHLLVQRKGKKNLYEKAMQDTRLWDIGNGRVLCRACHKKTDTFLNRWWKKAKQYV